jgi:hypothetical protein
MTDVSEEAREVMEPTFPLSGDQCVFYDDQYGPFVPASHVLGYQEQIARLLSDLTAATKRAEAAEGDAARYRYIRDPKNEAENLVAQYGDNALDYEVDTAIDTARAAQEQKK